MKMIGITAIPCVNQVPCDKEIGEIIEFSWIGLNLYFLCGNVVNF